MDKVDAIVLMFIAIIVVGLGSMIVLFGGIAINRSIEDAQMNAIINDVTIDAPMGVTYSFGSSGKIDKIWFTTDQYSILVNVTITINGTMNFSVEEDQTIKVLNSSYSTINGWVISTLKVNLYMSKSGWAIFTQTGKQTVNIEPLEG